MKASKVLVVMVALCGMMAFLITSGYAANQWYECTVSEAGPGWGATYIRLVNVDSPAAWGGAKWFKCKDAEAKQCLATAFTAMSNVQNVRINADLNSSNYPLLNAMYLQGGP